MPLAKLLFQDGSRLRLASAARQVPPPSCRGVAEMGKKENAKKLGHEHQNILTVALPVCSYEYASSIHGDHTTVRDPPASDRTCLTYRR